LEKPLAQMLATEIKTTFSIGLVFAFRMLGLFMIFPVLSLYTQKYPDASMTLIGVALGCYGLFQALLQLPMAALSDKFGRKPLILVGLLLFALGGIVAACSTTLWGIVIGRAIQGSGAIGATLLALAADSTRDVVRTRVMAIIGICIGASFTLAMVFGPVVDAMLGLKGLFLVSALLAGIAFILVVRMPTQDNKLENKSASFAPKMLLKAIQQPHLWRLYISVFMLHALLTMSFLVIPLKIQMVAGLSAQQSWQFYIPVLLISLVCVMPFVRRGDDSILQKKFFVFAVMGLLCILPCWLWTGHRLLFMGFGVLFFVLFNYLEASMPAMVSKIAPSQRRGLILGVYSSCQFLGLFVGGTLGGWCMDHWGITGIVSFSIVLLFIWLLSIFGLNFNHNEELSWQEV